VLWRTVELAPLAVDVTRSHVTRFRLIPGGSWARFRNQGQVKFFCGNSFFVEGVRRATDERRGLNEVLAEMRDADPPVHYLVGTPKGRLTRLEKHLIAQPWQEARPGVQVKLLAQEGELYATWSRKSSAAQGNPLSPYWQRQRSPPLGCVWLTTSAFITSHNSFSFSTNAK
jgi:hypothetical protein